MRYRISLINPFGKTVMCWGAVGIIGTDEQARQIANEVQALYPGMTTRIESFTLANKLPLEV